MGTNHYHCKKQWIPSTHSRQYQAKITNKIQNSKPKLHDNNRKWISFKYYSPIVRRITNLFKDTNLNISFKPFNTKKQQLIEKEHKSNPSGIYKLQCNTCKDVYIGQSGRDINVRYKEHVRYIRTNNPTSAYATHILNNNHEYGQAKDTVQILKKCDKGIRMNCWEAMFVQTYYQKGNLVTEQQVNEHNPLFELMHCKQPPTQSPNS